MTKNNSGFVHIVLLVAAFLVGIGVISYFAFKNGQVKVPSTENQASVSNVPTTVLSPTSTSAPIKNDSKTANWKTYTNTRFGYSFKYPKDWILRSAPIGTEDNGNLATSTYIILLESDQSPTAALYFSISQGENTSAKSRGYNETEKIGDIVFAKLSHPNGDGPSSTPDVWYEVTNNGYHLVITATGYYPVNEMKYQIISTLKFIGNSGTEF